MENAELHKQAYNLAEMTLANGFDIDAYILKVISGNELAKAGVSPDLAPDSGVDECINDLLQAFMSYYKSGGLIPLENMMKLLKSIISETYHGAATLEEKQLIAKYIKKIGGII